MWKVLHRLTELDSSNSISLQKLTTNPSHPCWTLESICILKQQSEIQSLEKYTEMESNKRSILNYPNAILYKSIDPILPKRTYPSQHNNEFLVVLFQLF